MTGASVVVIGGGPAGSATAFFLARAGVDVLVLDRARFPREKPCSEYMSPEASRLLHRMEALDSVERAGAARLAGMMVHAPNGAVIRGCFSSVSGYRGFRDHGLALPRTRLDPILLERARSAGAMIEEGARVIDLEADAHGRIVGVRVAGRAGGPRAIGARLVVGADGLRSIVARRLGVAYRRWGQRRLALVAHFQGVAGMTDCGEMHVERDGYLGLADVGGGLTNVAVVVPAAIGRGAAGDASGFMEAWIARHGRLAGRFAGATRVDRVMATGPFASASRRAWAPGAALVGDAADFFDPFTGEGIYAALRGAELLAPRIADALATHSTVRADSPLAEYDRDRRREFGGKWQVEQIIGAAVTFPGLMNLAARSLELRPHMAHTLVGVTGDFVPAREVLKVGFLTRLLMPWVFGAPGSRSASRESVARTSEHS